MIDEARGSSPESLFAFSIQATVDAQKGAKMTVAEICVTTYLVVALPATVLIWSALVASKRRQDKARPVKQAYFSKSRTFRERQTRPSRLHP